MTQKKIILALSVGFVVFAVFMRLTPHIANVAPIGALALFAGVYLDKKYAILLPLSAMLISDLFIGFYSLPIMLSVYGSFALIGVMGILIREKKNFFIVTGTTLAGSLLFFAVTNWAVWAFSPLYEPSVSGLVQSYVMGLPFLKGTLAGDFMYVGVFFGVYEFALYTLRRKAAVKQLSVSGFNQR